MFPQIFGKYVLERELASGGMARVYLATLRGAVGFEKRLVVKQIRPELSLDEAFVKRFVEEAKIAVELSHPNIVPVYELGVELGIYYIAMELCEGLTLTEVLMDTGPLDAAEGAHVGIEICRALDYAHRRGNIVHRDVTPRNVLLDEEGAVRLIDFGIAAPQTSATSTERVEVFGSPGHMPPEQIRGERLTPATDVFAVGALLIEAWTGRPPFRRGSFEASADALKEPLPSLAIEHAELAPIAEIVAQAVALRALDRPQEAEALARKLREFSRQFDSGDVAKRLGTRVRRARRRGRSSAPWLPGDTSGPMTPAASPRALLSSRPPGSPETPATPPMPPLTPATPAGGAPITRTFAAREDLVEWTRRIASVPPLADQFEAQGAESSSPPAVVDEPATRAMPRSSPPLTPPAKPFPWAIAASSAALLGVVAWVATRGVPPENGGTPAARGSSEPTVSLPATDAALPAVSVVPVSSETAPFGVTPAGSATTAPSPVRSAPPKTAAASPSASAGSAGDTSASAQLRLTADPQATVTIVGPHGAQTHETPVRGLKLAPGAYSVTFRSPTFGEPVVARVELASGVSRSVHADFRAAFPSVVVH
jgi:eukaryotic-like serine/threonine-protein kinase